MEKTNTLPKYNDIPEAIDRIVYCIISSAINLTEEYPEENETIVLLLNNGQTHLATLKKEGEDDYYWVYNGIRNEILASGDGAQTHWLKKDIYEKLRNTK